MSLGLASTEVYSPDAVPVWKIKYYLHLRGGGSEFELEVFVELRLGGPEGVPGLDIGRTPSQRVHVTDIYQF